MIEFWRRWRIARAVERGGALPPGVARLIDERPDLARLHDRLQRLETELQATPAPDHMPEEVRARTMRALLDPGEAHTETSRAATILRSPLMPFGVAAAIVVGVLFIPGVLQDDPAQNPRVTSVVDASERLRGLLGDRAEAVLARGPEHLEREVASLATDARNVATTVASRLRIPGIGIQFQARSH